MLKEIATEGSCCLTYVLKVKLCANSSVNLFFYCNQKFNYLYCNKIIITTSSSSLS